MKESVEKIMEELRSVGSDQTKKVLMKHGAKEPFFGVKVQDLKKIVKRVKADHELALALYATGNSDAMYLAGLIAEPKKMSSEQLDDWADQAYWYMLSEYTVAWVAGESPMGWQKGLEWIDHKEERVAAAGWGTLSGWLMKTPDDQLDHSDITRLLARIENSIHHERNRVKYAMNSFLLSLAICCPDYTKEVESLGKKIGTVTVDMGGTSCKVPDVITYVENARKRNRIGKKKKNLRC